ncbi:MAG: hypothetical protein U9R41_03455 [Candidatus Marinimicrobia bacterium]|nr:hypothetical protein [Candidatus Neomarinimicrobiota bacterium]
MLKNKPLFLFLLSFFVIAFQCTDVENPDSPEVPKIVTKSAPEKFIEKGIDAIEGQDAIIIQWEANSEKDLEGYYIYRAADTINVNSDDELKYSKIAAISVNYVNPIATATEYIDYDASVKIQYFYYIRAFNQSENVSDPSDTVSYKLAAKPTIVCPQGDVCPEDGSTASQTPTFSFKYSPDIDYGISYFIIKVADINGDSLWCYGFPREGYAGRGQKINFNEDGNSLVDTLTSGGQYQWKIDAISPTGYNTPEIEGAESAWIQFKVKEN